MTAPEPLTAEERTRPPVRRPAAAGVGTALIGLVVTRVGTHALMHPSLYMLALAALAFAAGIVWVSRTE